VLAARLERYEGGTKFSYLPGYLASAGPAVASSLPLSSQPVLSGAGAAPPYFTGLLPEGRRLNALRRSIKTSADDDLSLLIAAGGNPVGDVQIVGHAEPLNRDEHAVQLDRQLPLDFDQLLGDPDLIDPVALAGVQDKLSAGMISVPVASTGRQFILKLDAPEFPHVVENEFVMFRYAAKLRIPLSRVQLIRDVAGRPGLLVERFDRVPEPGNGPHGVQRLAVEDGAQVLKLYPADKYNVGYGQVCHALADHCSAPLPALRNLAIQAAYAWLTGNGDLHAKNVSMVQQPHGEWTVAPVYDIPSTVVYGDKTLALTINGKRTGISRRHFLGWVSELGLTDRAAGQVVELALKASGPLIADLESGTAFGALKAAGTTGNDDAGFPFPKLVTTSWVKELKHRRRSMEG
jgi:serine/threonine-protein kinase HipA